MIYILLWNVSAEPVSLTTWLLNHGCGYQCCCYFIWCYHFSLLYLSLQFLYKQHCQCNNFDHFWPSWSMIFQNWQKVCLHNCLIYMYNLFQLWIFRSDGWSLGVSVPGIFWFPKRIHLSTLSLLSILISLET